MKKTGWLFSLMILSFWANDPPSNPQVNRSAETIINERPIELSEEHSKAVNRRRRIVVQYDVFDQRGGETRTSAVARLCLHLC